MKVLKVGGVGDLPGGPRALVFWVVDQRRTPLALVIGVGAARPDPFAASRSLVTERVADSGSDPVTIFLIIPFLGLLSI